MTDLFESFAVIIAIGIFLDTVASPDHKSVISDYIFSKDGVDVREFEFSLTRYCFGVFFIGREINKLRLFLFTIATHMIFFIAINFLENDFFEGDWIFFFILYFNVFLIGAGFLIDYWSFFVTKQIFYRRSPRYYFFAILIDIFLSSFLLLVVISLFAVNRTVEDEIAILIVAFFVSALSSSIFSIIQLSILIFGLSIRFIRLFNFIHNKIAHNSRFYSYPISYLMIFSFLISNILIHAARVLF